MLHEIAVHRYGHRSSTELPLWLCSQSTEWASSVGVDSIAVVYQATSNKSISFTFIFSYMVLDSCRVGVVSSGLGAYYINTGDECSRGYALAEELAANYWDVERKWSTVRSLGRTKHPTKLGFTGLGSG